MNKLETAAWLCVLLAIFGLAARSAAEDTKKPMGGRGMHECPMMKMRDGTPIADVAIENTDKGAVIRLTAKRLEDVKAVREAAQHIAEHAKSGCSMQDCAMMGGNDGMGGKGMMGGGMMGGHGTGAHDGASHEAAPANEPPASKAAPTNKPAPANKPGSGHSH